MYIFLSVCALVLSGLVLLWFGTMSAVSSSVIIVDEVTLYINDNVLFTIVAILLLITAGIISYKNKPAIQQKLTVIYDKTNGIVCFNSVKNTFVVLSIIECIVFVFITRMYPTDDQETLINAVEQFKNGNYSGWASGEYFSMWPHQNGLVLFIVLLSYILPKYYVLAFQLLNCIAVGGIYYYTDKILEKEGIGKFSRLVVLISYFVFFPFRMYVTFVYGTILGLFFSVIAIYMCIKYLKDGQIKNAILSGIYCSLSSIAKSNYSIFIIGIVIFIVLYILKNKSYRKLSLIAIIGAIYFILSFSVKTTMHSITGEDVNKGMSSFSYFAMGLHENVYRGPGWRDETHIEKYKAGLNNEGEEKRLAVEDLKNSISNFKSGERNLWDFLGRKESSIWSNPSFQGQWINVRNDYQTKTGSFAEWLLSIKTTLKLLPLIDLFLVIIYLGNLLYILLTIKNHNFDIVAVLFNIIFLGGVIIHTIWEAKAQYSLPYFMMLIPYGVIGFITAIKLVSRINSDSIKAYISSVKNKITSSKSAKLYLILCSICIIVVLGCLWKGRGIVNNLVAVNHSQSEYERYRDYYLNNEPTIDENVYVLKAFDCSDLMIKDTEAFSSPVVSAKNDVNSDTSNSDNLIVSIENTNDKSMIKICGPDNYLGNHLKGFTVSNSIEGGMYTEVSSIPYCGFHDFEIIPSGDNDDTYFIKTIDTYYMTMSDNGEITMELFEGKDCQKWKLEKTY